MMILENPASGTHWFIGPNDEKCVRRRSRITGSKNDLGRDVTARVLVRMTSGEHALGDTAGLLRQLRIIGDEGSEDIEW